MHVASIKEMPLTLSPGNRIPRLAVNFLIFIGAVLYSVPSTFRGIRVLLILEIVVRVVENSLPILARGLA